MENNVKTQQELEQEMLELNDQFVKFLHTKGIVAKFKLAFGNMSESAQKQHKADVASFNAVKAQSAEDNKEFVEFLHTKGLKAKFKLVIENIKKGAKAAPANTAAQIAKVKYQTQNSVTIANALGNPSTAASLQAEFAEFLRSKGLDGKYTVSITEE